MNGYYTYVHRRKDTGEVFYVGKGKGKRAWRATYRNPYWQRIAGKYGFTVEIVADGLTETDAHRQEKRLVKLYSREHLANLTDGGDGISGWKHAPATLAKLRVAAKSRRPVSVATRAKLSAAGRGRAQAPEHVRKRIEARFKPVTCGDMDFASAKLAAEWLRSNGYPRAAGTSIAAVCKGRHTKAYGRLWSYS